jgi:hypothetical protein
VSNSLKSAALSALRVAVRPVFRILLRSGVTWQEVSEVCKMTLVEVATAHFGLHGRPTNMSRVAIMTGLGRREVKRLRGLLDAAPAVETDRMGGAARLLSGWHLDPEFVDAAGAPLELPFEAAAGPSFNALCKRYAGDLAAITLRRELGRVKALEELPDGRLRVLMRYYQPLQMDPDAIVRGGSMLGDIGVTVCHNLGKSEAEPFRFAGRATNIRVRANAVPRFREYLDHEGQAFLERVDEWLSRHDAPEPTPRRSVRTVRLGVGVYHIEGEP